MLSSVKSQIRYRARNIAKFIHRPMNFPPYPPSISSSIQHMADDIRYATLALAIQRLETDRIEGAFAELGVYQGHTSKFMHAHAPQRTLYLFDTFEGFPTDALGSKQDNRFKDTSQQKVADYLGNDPHILFRVGYFPQSAAGLEAERFALVMLDFDLYKSALEAFKFFYPRMVSGAYFFMHDFNSPESERAISRAAAEFLQDKPEKPVEIPDEWGSAVFRKI